MAHLYRTAAGQREVQSWCHDRLDAWDVAHETRLIETEDGPIHVVEAGAGPTTVIYLPGTNFNAATSLILLEELATRCTVRCVDLPGQPGLSAAQRPSEDPLVTRAWLSPLLAALRPAGSSRLILAGHSRGAAVALSAFPKEVDSLALISPAGLIKANASWPVLRTALPWMLRPRLSRSAALLRLMSAPGRALHPESVEWLTLVALHCRTTGAPKSLPPEFLRPWRGRSVAVTVGAHDCFFPPRKLAVAAQDRLDARLIVMDGVGHLTVEEEPAAIADLILHNPSPIS
jgi:pimeloyl-ACP methyl ester carboxylesterase